MKWDDQLCIKLQRAWLIPHHASLLQVGLSDIRLIQWWRPAASFITNHFFATCVSLSVSRSGLAGEEGDQVTLMHRGCSRTHARLVAPLPHPHPRLPHPHNPVSWSECKAPAWPRVIVPPPTCERVRRLSARPSEKSLVSKNKPETRTVVKRLNSGTAIKFNLSSVLWDIQHPYRFSTSR